MAKTKALISFAVTAKLICVFVFAYAKIRFSHVAAQIVKIHMNTGNGNKTNFNGFLIGSTSRKSAANGIKMTSARNCALEANQMALDSSKCDDYIKNLEPTLSIS